MPLARRELLIAVGAMAAFVPGFADARGGAVPGDDGLHNANFARRETSDRIEAQFDVLQIDLFGAREVLDFDGEAAEERAPGGKWAVSIAPTTPLFRADNAGAGSPEAAETFRIPGYLKPFHYPGAPEYAQSGVFGGQGFERVLQDGIEDFRKRGIALDVW